MPPTEEADDDTVTLYDIDPVFQNRILKWLTETGSTIDIGVSPEGFVVTASDGSEARDKDLEASLNGVVGSHAKLRRIDRAFGKRVAEFLTAHSAHITFQAEGDGFHVAVSSHVAKGESSDEDFEFALVYAEEKFLAHAPAHPMPPEQHRALEQALVPAAQRQAEQEEQLRRALMEPRAGLEENGRMRENAHHSSFAPMPGRRRFMVVSDDVILGFGFMSRDEARHVADDAKAAGDSFEIIEYVAGSEQDPRMHEDFDENPHKRLVARRPPGSRGVWNWLEEHDLADNAKLYTPQEWRARGEQFGNDAEFTITTEGTLYSLLNGHMQGSAAYELQEQFSTFLNEIGLWYDLGHAWSVHFYRTDMANNPHPMGAGGGHHGVSRERRAHHGGHLPGTQRSLAAHPGGSLAGAWRIVIAGDTGAERFGKYDDAVETAKQKYGPSGWQVEWASA